MWRSTCGLGAQKWAVGGWVSGPDTEADPLWYLINADRSAKASVDPPAASDGIDC